MKYISGENRTQITLLPDSIEDYVGEDNPVRVIDALVDQLDMEELGFERAKPNNTGRPSYDPRDILKLYIYGYFNKIRSSRNLQKECRRNLEVMYLLKKLVPDFRTIADFRKNNPKAIKTVFREFVRVCLKLNLYQREVIAIDGSKFRANNSDKNCYNLEVLEKKLVNIENHIIEYMSYLDHRDGEDVRLEEATKEQVNLALEELRTRKEKYISYQEQLKQTGNTQLLTTDPDARRMHSKDGFHPSYNAQTAVDDGSHLIAAYTVTSNTDMGNLKSVSDEAKRNLGVDTIEALADKGYDSNGDVLNCLMSGTLANPSLKEEKEDRIFNIEYIENEIDEPTRTSTNPEDIKKCLHAGVLPQCYENKEISIECQHSENDDTVLSCFTRDENTDTVVCPMGEILYKIKVRRKQTHYQSRIACRFCTNKCTKSKVKVVSFGPGKKYVPVRMNTCEEKELPLMPKNEKLPNNFTKKTQSKVLIRITHTDEMTTRRMCLSEHPFGAVKWYNHSHYLLCRGKSKVEAEIGLSFLAYNIKRAINMVGVRRLIEAL